MNKESLDLLLDNFKVLAESINENSRALRDPAITSSLGVVSGILKAIYTLDGLQQDTEKTIKGFGG